MLRLSWIVAPLGLWLVISPWVVTAGHSPTAGIIWNNFWIGGVALVLGLAATATLTAAGRGTTTQ